jgi:hypothetical protein
MPFFVLECALHTEKNVEFFTTCLLASDYACLPWQRSMWHIFQCNKLNLLIFLFVMRQLETSKNTCKRLKTRLLGVYTPTHIVLPFFP